MRGGRWGGGIDPSCWDGEAGVGWGGIDPSCWSGEAGVGQGGG